MKTLAPTGQVGNLTLDARDAAEAEQLVRKQGHVVLSVAQAGLALPIARQAARFPLLLFAQELLALLGVGAALLMELLDRRVRSAADLAEGLGLQVLANIDARPRKGRRPRLFAAA